MCRNYDYRLVAGVVQVYSDCEAGAIVTREEPATQIDCEIEIVSTVLEISLFVFNSLDLAEGQLWSSSVCHENKRDVSETIEDIELKSAGLETRTKAACIDGVLSRIAGTTLVAGGATNLWVLT
jgi:hypothetical protein